MSEQTCALKLLANAMWLLLALRWTCLILLSCVGIIMLVAARFAVPVNVVATGALLLLLLPLLLKLLLLMELLVRMFAWVVLYRTPQCHVPCMNLRKPKMT